MAHILFMCVKWSSIIISIYKTRVYTKKTCASLVWCTNLKLTLTVKATNKQSCYISHNTQIQIVKQYCILPPCLCYTDALGDRTEKLEKVNVLLVLEAHVLKYWSHFKWLIWLSSWMRCCSQSVNRWQQLTPVCSVLFEFKLFSTCISKKKL